MIQTGTSKQTNSASWHLMRMTPPDKVRDQLLNSWGKQLTLWKGEKSK